MSQARPTRCIALAVSLVVLASHGGRLRAEDKESTAWKAELKHTLKHKSSAYCVRFSPDNTRVLTASFDLTFRLWDLATGKELKKFQGKKAYDFIRDVAWTPDGKHVLLAAGQYKGTQRLTLWDVRKWRKTHQLYGHDYPVCRVAISGDGRTAVSGGWHPNVYIWDIEHGFRKKRYRPAVGQTNLLNNYQPDGEARSVDIAPDGKRALWAGGSFHYQLRLFDLKTGRPIRAYIPPPNEPSKQHIVHAAFSESGDRILAAHSYGFSPRLERRQRKVLAAAADFLRSDRVRRVRPGAEPDAGRRPQRPRDAVADRGHRRRAPHGQTAARTATARTRKRNGRTNRARSRPGCCGST